MLRPLLRQSIICREVGHRAVEAHHHRSRTRSRRCSSTVVAILLLSRCTALAVIIICCAAVVVEVRAPPAAYLGCILLTPVHSAALSSISATSSRASALTSMPISTRAVGIAPSHLSGAALQARRCFRHQRQGRSEDRASSELCTCAVVIVAVHLISQRDLPRPLPGTATTTRTSSVRGGLQMLQRHPGSVAVRCGTYPPPPCNISCGV